MEEVARYECVYNRGRKDFKDNSGILRHGQKPNLHKK